MWSLEEFREMLHRGSQLAGGQAGWSWRGCSHFWKGKLL